MPVYGEVTDEPDCVRAESAPPAAIGFTVTTIVHPLGGTIAPCGSVILVFVSVTFVQVPVLPAAVSTTTDVGMASVKPALNVCAAAVAFGMLIVNCDVAPRTAAIEGGWNAIASADGPVATVSGALAGSTLAGPICRMFVVAVTVPDVLEVTVTTIVQPLASKVCPAAIETCVDVTVVTPQVPVSVCGVMVTPAGMTTVNGWRSACTAATFGKLIVSFDVPPATMVAGLKDIAIVDAAPVIDRGALAAGVVPALVTSALVVLTTVPAGVAETPETANG